MGVTRVQELTNQGITIKVGDNIRTVFGHSFYVLDIYSNGKIVVAFSGGATPLGFSDVTHVNGEKI